MKKRVLSFILILCICTTYISTFPVVANAKTYDIYTYIVSNGEVTITDCEESSSRSITIPSTIDGYPVTSIGDYAFDSCRSLSSITIPDSVTTIGNGAFERCASLTNITIPDSVTTIGGNAFSSCKSLTNITIPDSVTTIGNRAFADCSYLENVIIGNSVTTIAMFAFSSCKSLTYVYYTGSVTQWKSISIYSGNDYLRYAIIHYNYSYDSTIDSVATPVDPFETLKNHSIYAVANSNGYTEHNLSIRDTGRNLAGKVHPQIDLFDISAIPFDEATETLTDCAKLKEIIAKIQAGVPKRTADQIKNVIIYAKKNGRQYITDSADGPFMLKKATDGTTEKDVWFTTPYARYRAASNGGDATYDAQLNSPYGPYFVATSDILKGSNELTFIIEFLDKGTAGASILYAKKGGGNASVGISGVGTNTGKWKTVAVSVTDADIASNNDGNTNMLWNQDDFRIQCNTMNISKIMVCKTSDYEAVMSGKELPYNSNIQSNSTSTSAPVIKSVDLEYNNTCYDIVNQKVTVDVGSDEKANLTVKIDSKSALKPRVYITQGANTDLNDGKGMSLCFNNTNGKFEGITLGEKLKPDLPVYIFVIDEMTGQSTSMRTKLNMVDLNADDDFKKAQEIGEIKIGKDMMLTIPEDVPVIGGTELTWQFDFLPVTMTCSDDKMSFALGLDIADYNDGSDKDKKEGFDFKSFKETIDDYAESLNEYDGNIADAYKEQKKSLSQIKKEVLSKSDLIKNKGLNMSVFDNKPFVNTGSDKLGGGIEALGYVEVNKKNGEWNWNGASGHLLFQVKVSYTYNGQAFFYVIPLCYSFGGEASAGFKGEVKGMSQDKFQPYIESYLMAKLKLFVSGGVGIHKVANFNAKADVDLSFNYGLTDTATKPDELLLDGSVNFNVVVLGQEVAKLPIADLNDDNGIIYSTDPAKYDKSWIKPNSASSVSLMSVDEQMASYSANNVYENESRDYLENSMEWRGNMPPVSLFAADYTNKNLTVLADSVYPQAQPQISSINGKKILVFTADNADRTANNKQMLVYSVYNDKAGTWSAPVPVNDDGTADFYPSVSGEYLVWQNQKSVMDDDLSLAEIGKRGEIVIAKWNGNEFDAPVCLTDNDALDTLPKVSVNGDEITVVWLKNSSDDILGVDGDTSVVKKVYNGSDWGEEIVLKDNLNSVTDLSIGYCKDALNVAYVHDVDGDISTINDREIYLIGSSQKQVTDNEVLDSNAIINNGKLYWYSENNIHFMNLDDGIISTVFEDARYTLADGFTVSEDNGNIAILWSGSEDNSSEIKGVLYQDGAWGDVITVSELGAYAKYPTCVLEEDGTILTSFTAEADGITSLYTLGLFPSYDLAISDIYFDEKNLALNSENEFEVMVNNNGELPVEGYTISVYNEDGTLNNSIVFGDTIKAGESKSVLANFITGDAISYETLKIEIALNEYEEYVYDNNSVTLSVGNGDISLESLSVYEMLPTSYVVADVKNIGYSDISNITVNLRKDSSDGEIVKTQTVSSLTAGSNEEVTFAYNPADYENVKWFVTVEVEADEISVGNNYDYFINECAIGLKDYEISVLSYSYTDNQLTVNGYAKNNTNDTLTADAVFAVYSSDGTLKGVATQPLSVGSHSDTGIDVWLENYTYASGDYVKMFVLSGLTNLKPMVSAEMVNIVMN